ncbi:MAG: ATP phosphoribosyltransferase [Mongoliibacter sp.]|jgi:ATP phosphoribosyltransferase|uniref:ATP phosphoribosyltransferase n=1 Tax=Mongoliibacter sp. TaxID=2022438 RepID=UPI0012EF63E4|nr:ATP phosphoribosyltransferase [Mongoliibacter sp.]TVP49666.1 MAG: ATP phosphoribosyltransferase [Mongoliibacter sp.]
MNPIIRIAVQKSGRLSEDSLSLIKECGIKFYNGTGKLKSTSTNFPIEFLFLRDDDIPGYVADGVADLGIVGENELVEKDKDVNVLKKLGFSKCRLSLAIPKGEEYTNIHHFQGKNIATSYPKILSDFLENQNVHAEIHEISGSVEIAPSIGLAEGICDIVSSGSTLMMNGLKEVETIFKSEAVLICNKKLDAEKLEIVDKLLFRMNAVQKGKSNKYVLLNAPNDALDKIISLIPGMRSPTILPLAQEGWSSVHSVIAEDQFWENIEELRSAGAEGILVVPIEKMVI